MKRLLLIATVLPWGAALAAPFVPHDDTQVLERVRPSANPEMRELGRLRAALARHPDDLDQAVVLARRYLRLGRAELDPRWYGHAEGVLQPWWHLPEPPPAVRLLRATLRQNRHEFDAALDDLTKGLEAQPDDAQAWLTRAVILAVRGDYPAARHSCLPLMRLASTLVTIACLAQVPAPDPQRGYEALRQALEDSPHATPDERLWALTLLGEGAARMGWDRAAEAHFEQALALGVEDGYLLGAYADFLLDRGRAAEARTLLKSQIRADGLLLRLALAEQQQGARRELASHIGDLQARFAASWRRGDSVHLREQARFTLHLLGDAREALRLAQANWQVQKEPWDLRLLLEAASAAHDRAAARPALDWIARYGIGDVALRGLVERFDGARP